MARFITQTALLTLREFNLDDDAFILRLVNTKGWLTFIGDRKINHLRDAREYLTNGPMRSYKQNGFGLWMTEKTSDGCQVGMCGLVSRQGLPGPDLGFAFLPEFGGHGLALEAARASLAYSFETLGLPAVFAITMKENIRAINLLKKAGLRYEKNVLTGQPPNEEELMLFKINRNK